MSKFLTIVGWNLVNIVCGLVPFKKLRKSIREYLREHLLSCRIHLGLPRLPIKKRSRPINLAFGFDGGFVRQTSVAIASLLVNSKDRCSYNIYCVVDDSVTPDMRATLAGMVKTIDQDSTLTYLAANRDFDQARVDRCPLGTYYRLMLPALLPELDDIIYADGDVVFCRDLLELADLNLGENLIAAVMESDGYINAGFLVLNLARLRQEKTYKVWVEYSRQEQYEFQDQDLLNATCRGRILYLPVKFNFGYRMHYSLYRKGLIPLHDHYDLKYNAVMIHYLVIPKPWKDKKLKNYLNRLWWDYAKLTPFYQSLLTELQGNTI